MNCTILGSRSAACTRGSSRIARFARASRSSGVMLASVDAFAMNCCGDGGTCPRRWLRARSTSYARVHASFCDSSMALMSASMSSIDRSICGCVSTTQDQKRASGSLASAASALGNVSTNTLSSVRLRDSSVHHASENFTAPPSVPRSRGCRRPTSRTSTVVRRILKRIKSLVTSAGTGSRTSTSVAVCVHAYNLSGPRPPPRAFGVCSTPSHGSVSSGTSGKSSTSTGTRTSAGGASLLSSSSSSLQSDSSFSSSTFPGTGSKATFVGSPMPSSASSSFSCHLRRVSSRAFSCSSTGRPCGYITLRVQCVSCRFQSRR
mmetsp:Transcript_7699/g.24698  ORF Transcript_7699/g.24698 Transcript_7699/m.24698 type:complete len:319 (-) Transcript_7699:1456-2412(-)